MAEGGETDICPPGVDEIVEMNLMQLYQWCKKLGVPNLEDMETADQLRRELFDCLKSRSKLMPAPPVGKQAFPCCF